MPPRSLLALALLAALLALPGAALSAPGPERACLEGVARAVDACDTEAFERLVNMDAIAAQAFKELERMAKDPVRSKALPPLVALLASQGALSNPMSRDFLLSEARSFALYGVGSGAFAGKREAGRYKGEGMLAPLFELISMGRKEIRDIGAPRREGKWTILPFTLVDHGSGGSYRVLGQLSRAGDGFRLSGVANMRELVDQMAREGPEQEGGADAPVEI